MLSCTAPSVSRSQGLRKRKEVATQRALLELILEVSHVAAKVEKLLEEVAAADQGYSASAPAASGTDRNAGSGSSSGGELVAQCRLLERVAAEVSRLAFLANKGKDLAFVRSLEPRIAAHRSALRGRLSGALTAALADRNTAAALHALHAAADLGEAGPAEAAVRSVVVAPLVDRLELLVQPVAEGVCARYAALAEELLISVRKTESSLKRLKKAKGGAGGEEDPTATVSDSDKITLQLHLDVAELGQQLARLLGVAEGGSAVELPSFRRLQEVVAPPPGLLAAASGGAATAAV
ncbi:Conserved oligomeric Golgi complex subunit 2 [Tetrabaena socialis]|uniref:Conserved oligomeric Golgi complex subunit 2 n=1 Tax=Tetrabaena socialis TaxID=47790 RepID=A0A2J8AA54_9CHLO|nr:Conserved oligomeric Golgi complex subunit 2 [Tetrabaena socialis]|eukprot:PNH09416.1 Conserved oligomeric Golgi complex subunit 2 [Tetrabaena socialis]